MPKLRRGLAGFLLFILIVIPFTARAVHESPSEDQIVLTEDEVLDDNLMFATGTLDLKGTVKGDVIGAGGNITIDGLVEGDVIVAGGQVDIGGEVMGDVRVAGGSVTLRGKIGKNVNLFSGQAVITEEANISGSVLYGGSSLQMNGTIDRDFYGGGSKIVLNGPIGRRATIFSQGDSSAPILIGFKAVIQDGVSYTSSQDLIIADGAQINGEVKKIAEDILPEKLSTLGLEFALKILVKLFSAWIVGLVLIYLWKNSLERLTKILPEKPLPTFGWGAVVFFLTPIMAVLVMLTVIGIPLALIALAAWFIGLYISKIAVGLALGRLIFEKKGQKKTKPIDWRWPLVVGVGLVVLITSLPYVGWLVALFTIIFGLGILWTLLTEKWNKGASPVTKQPSKK